MQIRRLVPWCVVLAAAPALAQPGDAVTGTWKGQAIPKLEMGVLNNDAVLIVFEGTVVNVHPHTRPDAAVELSLQCNPFAHASHSPTA